MLYIIAYIFFKWLLWLIYRPKVFGNKKNLRIKGGVIFIANHRALYDPLLLVVSSPRIIHFMAKKELFDNPVGRVFFKSLFVFPVNRKTADMKSIRQSLKLLRDGKAFGIFPEGRRSATDGMDEFEKGTAFIAAKSGAPIVPIYINPKKSRSASSSGTTASCPSARGRSTSARCSRRPASSRTSTPSRTRTTSCTPRPSSRPTAPRPCSGAASSCARSSRGGTISCWC